VHNMEVLSIEGLWLGRGQQDRGQGACAHTDVSMDMDESAAWKSCRWRRVRKIETPTGQAQAAQAEAMKEHMQDRILYE